MFKEIPDFSNYSPIKFIYVFLLFCFITSGTSFAQNLHISGKVISTEESSGLPGATVLLKQTEDSHPGSPNGMVTDIEGNFRFQNLDKGTYTVTIQFIGYEPKSLKVELIDTPVSLGRISLSQETTTLQEITIIGKVPVGEQKSDTSEFNAGAFKVLPDASAQDLVEKMPGIIMMDGKIQAQGEDVQQILIDGKPFFGGDVNAALNSLPADAIATIQVFDQKSEKAILSGFDDGVRIKTINIITKPNRKKGVFGKSTGGIGTDDRYLLGSSVNIFNNDRRITITGLSNNINTLSYSADPNNDGQTRTQNGIISTNSIGANFIDSWAGKIDLSGSYFFTHRENIGEQYKFRDYVLPSDSGQVYTENNNHNNKNGEHQVSIRFDYKINERNRLIIRPSISLKNNKLFSYFLGNTASESGTINHTENTSSGDNLDYDYHNSLFFNHKFLKPGRSLTLKLNSSYHTNEDEAYRQANNIFYNAEDRNENLNQFTSLNRKGFNWEGGISYTEPLSKYSQVEIEYEAGNNLNDSDKRTYNFFEPTGDYTLLDTAISNTFESQYFRHEFEIGYQYKKKNLNIQMEGEYQHAQLFNDQYFPSEYAMERVFKNILPSARLEYKFSKTKILEMNYRSWTNEPSVGQLQNVIDNSNPLQLRTGNPDLVQSYNNWIRAQYRSHNNETNRSFYASLQSTFIDNFIANSTFIADEPTAISDDIFLERGSQLTRPENVNGFINIRSYFNYGLPLEIIKSNIGINGGIGYSKRPGLTNNEVNFSNTRNLRLGISLSSNISKDLDFNISSRSSYNMVENTLRPALNNNFFNQSTRLRLNWIIWKGIIYRTDLNHQVNSGLASSLNTNFTLWNMSIGKKVFKNQLGEFSLNIYDLLKQNNNIRRNITEVFIEDIQSNVLQRYFMLTFTYNIRSFSRGTTMDDAEKIMKK